MKSKLMAIAEEAAENWVALVRENEKDILDAWHQAEKEAQLQEEKPKMRLGFGVALDIDSNKVTYALRWAVTKTREVEGEIPCPDQLTLDIKGGGNN